MPIETSSLHTTKLDELGTALEEELLGIELDEEGFDELELAMELELKIEDELGTEEELLELLGIELDELIK